MTSSKHNSLHLLKLIFYPILWILISIDLACFLFQCLLEVCGFKVNIGEVLFSKIFKWHSNLP